MVGGFPYVYRQRVMSECKNGDETVESHTLSVSDRPRDPASECLLSLSLSLSLVSADKVTSKVHSLAARDTEAEPR